MLIGAGYDFHLMNSTLWPPDNENRMPARNYTTFIYATYKHGPQVSYCVRMAAVNMVLVSSTQTTYST